MARGYQIKVDTSSALKGLGKLSVRSRAEVKKAVEEVGEVVLARARKLCPKRTGQLEGSLQIFKGKKSKTRVALKVGSSLPYTIFMELGVKPHTVDGPVFIEYAAKTKTVKIGTLGTGYTVPYKGLPEATFRYIGKHPGIKAHRFLKRAVSQTKRKFQSSVRKAMKKAVKESGK